MECPRCGSKRFYRSRHRTAWELWRKKISERRLYRCHTCQWRGWLNDSFYVPTSERIKNAIAFGVMVSISIAVTVLLLPLLD